MSTTKAKSNKVSGNFVGHSTAAGPLLKFNYIERDTLTQTRVDVRALTMLRGYQLYVTQHLSYKPSIGEIVEQCIMNTLSSDSSFTTWFAEQDKELLQSTEIEDETASVVA